MVWTNNFLLLIFLSKLFFETSGQSEGRKLGTIKKNAPCCGISQVVCIPYFQCNLLAPR